MIWPPSVLRIELESQTRHFRLWLPIFAIWPFVLLAAVVVAPIVLALAIVFWWTGWGRTMLYSGPLFFALLCALRGLEIDVRNRKEHVYLSFR